jgi:hypothetical protein
MIACVLMGILNKKETVWDVIQSVKNVWIRKNV